MLYQIQPVTEWKDSKYINSKRYMDQKEIIEKQKISRHLSVTKIMERTEQNASQQQLHKRDLEQ